MALGASETKELKKMIFDLTSECLSNTNQIVALENKISDVIRDILILKLYIIPNFSNKESSDYDIAAKESNIQLSVLPDTSITDVAQTDYELDGETSNENGIAVKGEYNNEELKTYANDLGARDVYGLNEGINVDPIARGVGSKICDQSGNDNNYDKEDLIEEFNANKSFAKIKNKSSTERTDSYSIQPSSSMTSLITGTNDIDNDIAKTTNVNDSQISELYACNRCPNVYKMTSIESIREHKRMHLFPPNLMNYF